MKIRRIDQILVKVSGQTNDLTANSADPFGQFSKFLKTAGERAPPSD